MNELRGIELCISLFQPTPEETSENTYHLPDDVDEEGEVDQGPDLDNLIDRMLTLTPDTHPPTEFSEDRPPALPPKMSRKQNGVVPHTKENNETDGSGTPPEIPPRREKRETLTSDSTVSKCLIAYIYSEMI